MVELLYNKIFEFGI